MVSSVPSNPAACFSTSYQEARSKFWAACQARGVHPTEHVCPEVGPDGETLALDEARFGSPDAKRLLLILSGTHGVEGFCGSGIQLNWLRNYHPEALPPDLAVILLHAVNPYGFAWLRRSNESNIDLNRNFVDFSMPPPENRGYIEIAELLCPSEWSEATQERTAQSLDAFRQRVGDLAFMNSVAGGQYTHPQGLFFGGHSPSWSHRTLKSIIAALAPAPRHAATIDLHSGLGPYGYGDVRNGLPPSSPDGRRAIAWYGQVTNPTLMDDAAVDTELYRIEGSVSDGIAASLPEDCVYTRCALEFGTSPVNEVLTALRAECWLHFHGRVPESSLRHPIKDRLRNAFYPDKDDWKTTVCTRATEVIERAVRGLMASG